MCAHRQGLCCACAEPACAVYVRLQHAVPGHGGFHTPPAAGVPQAQTWLLVEYCNGGTLADAIKNPAAGLRDAAGRPAYVSYRMPSLFGCTLHSGVPALRGKHRCMRKELQTVLEAGFCCTVLGICAWPPRLYILLRGGAFPFICSSRSWRA